jgi:ABC-type spermidine/putrescine transport system permease subunit II
VSREPTIPKIFAALVAGFLLAPLIALIPVAFTSAQFLSFPPPGFSLQWLKGYALQSHWIDAAFVSLRVGLLAAAIAAVLGSIAAWILVRTRLPGKWAFEFLVVSPMFMPYVVLALGLFFVYSQLGMMGTEIGIALAHAVVGLPLVTIVVSSSLPNVDPMLERAAASLGASRSRTVLEIILPIILPGVIAGAFLAFLVSWDELLIALFVGSFTEPTLPRLLWTTTTEHFSPGIAAVSLVLVAVTLLLLVVVEGIRKVAERIMR